jgi:hypothetical protein
LSVFYLSNAVREEVGIILNDVGNAHYEASINFLKEHLHKWMLETSIDGKIRKAQQVIEGPGVRFEYGPKGCIVYIFEIPKIHEIMWADLITNVEGLLVFPNHCFLVDSVVVSALLEALPGIPAALVYKALLEICDPFMIEEKTFQTLQNASSIPVQDELENVSNVVLVDRFIYEVHEQQPVQMNPYQIIQLALGSLDGQDLELLEGSKIFK